ncbi:helix-turn-helix domain-containing protein [Streptomyces broussonetiae]|uniref:Helix-turn-helix transcriptional regulator n=1 Tax=Streptomyces broussonetiae TaxID=2686304 RepID=A0ABV5EJY5_9ACTN
MDETGHKKKQEINQLGKYIRNARMDRGISLRRLADQLHMHHSYMSRIESGALMQPSPEKLQRIAEILDLKFSDLCALAGYQAPEELPSFGPYLRAKYNMSDEDHRRLFEYFMLLRDHHGITERPQHPKGNSDQH